MKTLSAATAALLCTASLSAMAQDASTDNGAFIAQAIDGYSERMREVADTIWANPELGYLETATSALLQEELAAAGFEVESNVVGAPTAFVASSGSGDGPTIAILAEMDALPGFSQAATPQREPVEGEGSGHACGHHLFGAGSVGAAIAVAQWLEETGTPGQVRVYGTPAEEGGSGKVYMVREGLFDDVDVALHWHPGDQNSANQRSTLANVSGQFRFFGQSAHAAISPESGRSALDAVEAMNFMVNMMREHVPQESRIHYAITAGGEAPNVVPDFAESYYYVRHPDPAVVADVIERVENAAEGAALGTGTSYEFEILGGVYSTLPNDTLGRLMHESLTAVGGPQWTEADFEFGAELQQTVGDNTPPLSRTADIEPYEFGGQGFASTDVGDVSWVVPTVGLTTATYPPGVFVHTWQAVAAGVTNAAHEGMEVAAETLALTATRLFEEPEIIAAATEEFETARGEDFTYRPLIGDREPPLDYRVSAAQ